VDKIGGSYPGDFGYKNYAIVDWYVFIRTAHHDHMLMKATLAGIARNRTVLTRKNFD
jgi:hypothetical protein